jgi:hypothetical protein
VQTAVQDKNAAEKRGTKKNGGQLEGGSPQCPPR